MINNLSINDSEKEIILKAQEGDLQAFEELIKPYQTKVFGLAYHIAGNNPDAEDLFQEAFLRVYRNIRQYSGTSSFGTWLYSVCKNTFLNEIKKKQRIKKKEMSLKDDLPKNETAPSLSTKKHSDDIEQILRVIPLKFRCPIILFDLQGYNYREIAEILKTTVPGVKNRILKGRKILKKKFKKSGDF